jgi:hypothetical protein
MLEELRFYYLIRLACSYKKETIEQALMDGHSAISKRGIMRMSFADMLDYMSYVEAVFEPLSAPRIMREPGGHILRRTFDDVIELSSDDDDIVCLTDYYNANDEDWSEEIASYNAGGMNSQLVQELSDLCDLGRIKPIISRLREEVIEGRVDTESLIVYMRQVRPTFYLTWLKAVLKKHTRTDEKQWREMDVSLEEEEVCEDVLKRVYLKGQLPSLDMARMSGKAFISYFKKKEENAFQFLNAFLVELQIEYLLRDVRDRKGDLIRNKTGFECLGGFEALERLTLADMLDLMSNISEGDQGVRVKPVAKDAVYFRRFCRL